MVVGDGDKTVRVWRLDDGVCVATRRLGKKVKDLRFREMKVIRRHITTYFQVTSIVVAPVVDGASGTWTTEAVVIADKVSPRLE